MFEVFKAPFFVSSVGFQDLLSAPSFNIQNGSLFGRTTCMFRTKVNTSWMFKPGKVRGFSRLFLR